jgi:hypothetical protein
MALVSPLTRPMRSCPAVSQRSGKALGDGAGRWGGAGHPSHHPASPAVAPPAVRGAASPRRAAPAPGPRAPQTPPAPPPACQPSAGCAAPAPASTLRGPAPPRPPQRMHACVSWHGTTFGTRRESLASYRQPGSPTPLRPTPRGQRPTAAGGQAGMGPPRTTLAPLGLAGRALPIECQMLHQTLSDGCMAVSLDLLMSLAGEERSEA